MDNIKISEEQTLILRKIKESKNVICDAVAGSGKTTTILFSALKFPNKRILQITYNSQLKLEVREKVKKLSLTNIEIHSYHSLAVKYYSQAAYRDKGINAIIKKNYKIKRQPNFDIVIVDETQDMTLLYYHLVKKFIVDIGNNIILIFLGDKYQGLYQFKDADIRYLTLADKLWSNNNSYEKMSLRTSYRVTKPIAWFVNNVMLDENRLIAIKKGYPIYYISYPIFDVHNVIIIMLLKLLDSKKILPQDIFILSGSVRSKMAPFRKLENCLVENGIPCFVPTSDDAKIDDDVIKEKVLFTTFHQAKGRERKLVIIYNFDNSYFSFYGKDLDPNLCPSTLYVGATRASERLYLIEDNKFGPLRFLKKTHLELTNTKYVKFIGKMITTLTINIDKKKKTSPTDMVRFLKNNTINFLIQKIESVLQIETVAGKLINMPSKIINSKNQYEQVNNLNGLIIPCIYESKNRKGQNSLMEYIQTDPPIDAYLINAVNKIIYPCQTIKDFIYLTIVYYSLREKLYFKIAQITHYDWLTKHIIKKCIAVMEKNISKNTKYEYELPEYVYKSTIFGKIFISCRLDAIDKKTVWEFKCTEELSLEDKLQLIIYAWLWKNTLENEKGSKVFKLLNILTGEIYVLNYQEDIIQEIILAILHNKFDKTDDKTDSEFVKETCKV